MLAFENSPTTWPGSRVPNVWLAFPATIPENVVSTRELAGTVGIHDLLDPLAFTLIRFDKSLDASLLLSHAEKVRMPLTLLDVQDHCSDATLFSNAQRVYEKKMLLVRPDQHVAWRSDIAPTTPSEASYILDVARGAILKRPAPGIPILSSLYALLVRKPLQMVGNTGFGRAVAQKYFELGLVGMLVYRLSILARLKLLWLWLTV